MNLYIESLKEKTLEELLAEWALMRDATDREWKGGDIQNYHEFKAKAEVVKAHILASYRHRGGESLAEIRQFNAQAGAAPHGGQEAENEAFKKWFAWAGYPSQDERAARNGWFKRARLGAQTGAPHGDDETFFRCFLAGRHSCIMATEEFSRKLWAVARQEILKPTAAPHGVREAAPVEGKKGAGPTMQQACGVILALCQALDTYLDKRPYATNGPQMDAHIAGCKFLASVAAGAPAGGTDQAPAVAPKTWVCMHGVYHYPGNGCGYCAASNPEAVVPERPMAWKKANPDCELCRGSGYYGDRGPGIKGNAEYQRCECTEAPEPIESPSTNKESK